MRIRLIRHATLIVEYAGSRLLVDPMLRDAGSTPPIENTPNPRRNPLVPLPIEADEIVRGIAAVLVTHTHSDHWDDAAARLLPKDIPLFGQQQDQAKFATAGFSHASPIANDVTWNNLSIARTGGQHGTGEIGRKMAPVSGFVLRASGEPTLYIAGDTIWCKEVNDALRRFQPNVIVVNAGGARFLEGDPITMTPEDLIATSRAAPKSHVIAVHMEAINHCLVTRSDLAFQLEAARVAAPVSIPADGEWLELSAN